MTHSSDDGDNSDVGDRTADPEKRPMAVSHDWSDARDPSVAIVEAVAAATNQTATGLPPLQNQIDTDALNSLLTHRPTSKVEISFTYADSTVSVTGKGTIEIHIDDSPTDEESE